MQRRIISAFHDSPMGGHSGFPVTYRCIRRLFSWPKMKAHVQQYVRCCQVCQQAKSDRTASPGLLMPLPIPRELWDLITMDFMDGLPQSGQHNCLLVVVDKRTRFAHFLPLAHPYTASKLANIYMQQLYKLHGFPGAIVSDRDPILTSHFWQELFKYAGTELRMSTANHPQTDGQTERVNQCIETYLRCFIQACPKRWSFLGTSGAVLVQLVASHRHGDDAVQGHVWERTKALGDHCINIVVSTSAANVA